MKLILTTAAAFLIASQAVAGSWQTRCQTDSVPYQVRTSGGTTQQILGGAVIGGVVGKVVTKKDGGALAGAVIGGAIANESAKKTVTKYRDVETCKTVYVPERITDEVLLQEVLLDLNEGRPVSNELTRDAQYTLGVGYDGKWGPKSVGAAEEYLAQMHAEDHIDPAAPMYSLIVNDVVILTSADVIVVDQIRTALTEAGVESQIVVGLVESS